MTNDDALRRDPTRTGKIAIAAIWLWFAAAAAEGLGRLGEIGVLGGFGGVIASHDALVRSDNATAALSALSIIGLAIAAAAVLRWVYMTNRNAHALSDRIVWGPRTSPFWSVAWFFVPVAGLIRPFSVFSATWRISASPDAYEMVGVPALLRWWWGLWLANAAVGKVASTLHDSGKVPGDMIGADYVLFAKVLIDLPLTIVLTVIILRLSQWQRAALARGEAPLHQDDEVMA
ncbi:DUF4328 domain-containing protein [Sphingomonas sp. 8AM]|uniref:DUF4328 domain-containing protein n=1 Tax=Sphingomonas sp. 8AM TaxID=2653170 RepID=UPI0013580699|nr:DUF4328 domain-containing protein [Sphingomonas sp. 8AM]